MTLQSALVLPVVPSENFRLIVGNTMVSDFKQKLIFSVLSSSPHSSMDYISTPQKTLGPIPTRKSPGDDGQYLVPNTKVLEYCNISGTEDKIL